MLAAGHGKRFASDIPKVMHLVGDQPMLSHVIKTGHQAGLDPLIVVLRPGMKVGDSAPDAIRVYQPPDDHGTAYAAEVGLDAIPSSIPTVAVLYGDSPLLRPATVRGVINTLNHADAVAAIAWADVPEPGSFGRLRIDNAGHVQSIIEFKDATPTDLALTSVNAGPSAFQASWLRKNLARVKPSELSGERYLTKLVELAIADGKRVAGHQVNDLDETIGCDTPERLALANIALQRREEESSL